MVSTNTLDHNYHQLSPHSSTDIPVKRNYRFHLEPDAVTHWHHWGLFTSAFYNALSIVFPAGETMFIRAVNSHKHLIPKHSLLYKQVSAFVSQEAIHGREHQELNNSIKAAYPAVAYVERWAASMSLDVNFGPAIDLATTCGLEHWTGILADQILQEPSVWTQAQHRYGLLWRWHAMEELEHKAVAFDVYQYVYGTGIKAYLRRCFWLLFSSIFLWLHVYAGFIVILCYDYQILNLYEHGRLLYMQWVDPGFFRHIIIPYWTYFKPAYHPWIKNNRHLLTGMHELQQQMTKVMKEA